MRASGPVLTPSMTDKQVLLPGPDHPISIEPTGARVTVTVAGKVVADTVNALTLQEASYPPVQYVPLADVDPAVLQHSDHTTHCPYKGDAAYFDLRVGDRLAENAVWTYAAPHEAVSSIEGYAAFYPKHVDAIEIHDGS
jgi:uncharacterized protein (DUF427 family)